MAQRQRLIVLLTSIAALTAACGAGTTGVTPNPTPSAASSATLAGAGSPPSSQAPISAPSLTSSAPTTGQTNSTITLGAFGQADGPGSSVEDAIAKPGSEPMLVNGILLRAADGTMWLCTSLATSTPPRCAEPRLLVKNWIQAPDDQTFVSVEGLHAAAGVRWIERMQLFGVVR